MSINANMKKYKVFILKEGKNKLLEPVAILEPFKEALISINQSVSTKNENGITSRYVQLKGLTYDISLKNNMIVKINGDNFKIINMPFIPGRKITFDLEEFKEC